MRNHLRFYLGQDFVELVSCAPTLSLLDWLRLDQQRKGTKEGCNEGDCGACTVVVGKIEQGRLVYRAVNACILFLPMLDGCQILTVEHLKSGDVLHPVQHAMVAFHASQCGFCTPGIVMSLFALWLNEARPLTARVEDVLAGNLCRCTGYRPIVEAALQMYDFGDRAQDKFILGQPEMQAKLLALRDEETLMLDSNASRLFAPATLDALAGLVETHPEATLVAGATDVGLWVTKGFRKLEPVILLNRVAALADIVETETHLIFGAMVPLTKVHKVLGALHPQIAEVMRRFGSEQVRNSGTIGGNIANGSPIGDLPPVLLALGARLVLRRGAAERRCALDDFFIAYKQQNIMLGEFLVQIEVPKLKPDAYFHVSKISKRFDEDISTLCGAFWLEAEHGKVKAARLGFGGMAATPKRARTAEAALIGKTWSEASAADAALVLAMDFSPLTDMRASADYRLKVAGNLIRRFALETLQPATETRGGVGQGVYHDSARKHVSGEAVYIDDMPEPKGLLHAYFGLSDRAHANILNVDLSAVAAAPDVVGVLTAADIPGVNDICPVGLHDEPVFATDKVMFHGQPLFAVIAKTRHAARHAARLAKIDYEDLPAQFDVASARQAGGDLVTVPLKLERGDVDGAMARAPHRLKASMNIGGQDHFYLEGHIALAVPGEDDDVTVYSSTQHPSEVQHMVAHVLGVASHAVTVEIRRMGGGFGGKETQSNLFASVAAVAAKKFNHAVKCRPDRDDDMIMTGKRHDFIVDYEVGYDDAGRILAVDFIYAARCGYSADLSGPVTDRALFHCDNAYFYPNVRAISQPLRTHTVSNTAFRGFGGPQGMLGAERIIEEVAFAVGKDPLAVRKLNFYGKFSQNITPYHQEVSDNIIQELVTELETTAHYARRRVAIREANARSPIIKRGIALTPVKFGISFTATWYNQGGALVNVYTDGSVSINHGGTEMGQGLHLKVAQVVASTFEIDLANIKITATNTSKVPNTSATAASSGTDLNAKAAQNAALAIKERLIAFAEKNWNTNRQKILFNDNKVHIGTEVISFAALVKAAYMARVQLSATGFYKTPKIHWDRAAGKGHPFYYFAYGAAIAEVAVDTLTGEYKELYWDEKGRLRTHAPSTYKIPVASDRPKIFNVDLAKGHENHEDTINKAKAVGEPPLMLGMSVLHALSDAVASVADYKYCPRLDPPATPEAVLHAIEALKAK
eukprot:gene7676-7737_t